MKTNNRFRLCLQNIHLLLQFAGVAPEVVSVKPGDVPGCREHQNFHSSTLAAVYSAMLSIKKCSDAIRMFQSIAADNRLGSIRRTIVTDYQSEGKVCLLRQHAFDRLGHEALVIVSDEMHINERRHLRWRELFDC